jgi:hypothetical protein
MIGKVLKRVPVTLASAFAGATGGSANAQNTGRTPANNRIEYHSGAVEWNISLFAVALEAIIGVIYILLT